MTANDDDDDDDDDAVDYEEIYWLQEVVNLREN